MCKVHTKLNIYSIRTNTGNTIPFCFALHYLFANKYIWAMPSSVTSMTNPQTWAKADQDSRLVQSLYLKKTIHNLKLQNLEKVERLSDAT